MAVASAVPWFCVLYNGHDKTFFFATYEGFQYPQAKTVQWPGADRPDEAGKLQPGAGSQESLWGRLSQQYALVHQFLGAGVSEALSFSELRQHDKRGGRGKGAGYNYIANLPNNYSSNQFDARVDHYFGQKALLFGRYTWKNIGLLSPNNLLVPESTLYDRYRILVTSFSYNFTPNLINEFRFGFTLEAYGKSNSFDGASITNAAAFNGVVSTYPFNGITELNFSNLTSLNAARLTDNSAGRLFQYNDNLTWVRERTH